MEAPDINPYATPQSAVQSIESYSATQAPDAGKGKRFLNFLIDRFAVVGIFAVIAIIVGVMEAAGMVRGGVAFFENISGVEDIAYTYLATFLYYTCFEGLFGRSLGKLITGTKVVMMTETPLTLRAVILRSLSRLVPFEPFSFLGGDSSGWHDKWTDTRVVDLRAKPVPKPRPMGESRMPRMYTPPQPR